MNENDEQGYARQKAFLDQNHNWPCDYLFKFIFKNEKRAEFEALFPEIQCTGFSSKPSENGNYISLTFSIRVRSSDEVLEFYARAKKITGIIAL